MYIKELGMGQDEIDRERISNAYRDSIIASVEYDESKEPDAPSLREAHQERGRQLDENESNLKEQYTEGGCEEQNGMSADMFRHQTISVYTHEQLLAQEQDVQYAQAYWGENKNVAEERGVAEVSDQYWSFQSATEESKDNVVGENENSNQCSL